MRRPSARWAAYLGACGAMVGLALFLIVGYSATHWTMATQFRLLSITDVLWPSSFWLLATDASENSLRSWGIVALSIVANGIVYGTVGLLASLSRTRAPEPATPLASRTNPS